MFLKYLVQAEFMACLSVSYGDWDILCDKDTCAESVNKILGILVVVQSDVI